MAESKKPELVEEPESGSNNSELVKDELDNLEMSRNGTEPGNCTEQGKFVSVVSESSDKKSELSELKQSGDSAMALKNSEMLLHCENFEKTSNLKGKERKDKKSSNEVVITSLIPLCADYGSDSESDPDSDSASSGRDTGSEFDSGESIDSNAFANKFGKGSQEARDLSLNELPPIENLKISVTEDDCVEIGTVRNIVEVLVIVDSYKGTSPLDVDTVLFLERGKKILGKVFDILGPITEPVYAVRFNTSQEIKDLNIKKDMKVYYAPKTEHTTFVFMSEVLKNKGSDASWKDNIEAPPEFQDFSDDEKERLHKNKNDRDSTGGNLESREPTILIRRPYRKRNPVIVPNLFDQTASHQTSPSQSYAVPPKNYAWLNYHNPTPMPPKVPYSAPDYPAYPQHSNPQHSNPQRPPRFSGHVCPIILPHPQSVRNRNAQYYFQQQTSHSVPQRFRAWAPPPPPPPPQPPSEKGDRRPESGAQPPPS